MSVKHAIRGVEQLAQEISLRILNVPSGPEIRPSHGRERMSQSFFVCLSPSPALRFVLIETPPAFASPLSCCCLPPRCVRVRPRYILLSSFFRRSSCFNFFPVGRAGILPSARLHCFAYTAAPPKGFIILGWGLHNLSLSCHIAVGSILDVTNVRKTSQL